MPTVRVPLVGTSAHRDSDDSDVLPGISGIDQRLVNVMFRRDTNPFTGAQRVMVTKRPGLEGAQAMPATVATRAFSAIGGLRDIPGGYSGMAVYLSSTDADHFRVVELSPTSGFGVSNDVDLGRGVFAVTRPHRYFDTVPNEFIAFTVWDSIAEEPFKSYVCTSGSNPLATEITDADFPDTKVAGSFVAKDGYLFIMTFSGRIYNSDLNAPTSWSATNYITTQRGDIGRGLAIYKDMIVALGGDYIEFYRNAGNASGSPLDRIVGMTITDYGIENYESTPEQFESSHHYLAARDTVFWVNSSFTGSGVGIYALDAARPKKISSPMVDLDLARNKAENIRIMGIIPILGYNYMIVATGNQSTDYVWVYCFETGSWVTWSSALFSNTLGGVFSGARNSAQGSQNVAVLSGTSIYEFDIESALSTDVSYTDNSVAVAMTIQTRDLDFGTAKKKRLNRMRLIGLDPREASTTGISWSDDDSQTFTTARNVDLNNGSVVELTRCGTFRRRSFRITNSADAPFDAEAIEFDFDILDR